jgi:hypothetical protein
MPPTTVNTVHSTTQPRIASSPPKGEASVRQRRRAAYVSIGTVTSGSCTQDAYGERRAQIEAPESEREGAVTGKMNLTLFRGKINLTLFRGTADAACHIVFARAMITPVRFSQSRNLR